MGSRCQETITQKEDGLRECVGWELGVDARGLGTRVCTTDKGAGRQIPAKGYSTKVLQLQGRPSYGLLHNGLHSSHTLGTVHERLVDTSTQTQTQTWSRHTQAPVRGLRWPRKPHPTHSLVSWPKEPFSHDYIACGR